MSIAFNASKSSLFASICNGSIWWSPSPDWMPMPSECAQLSVFVWAPSLFFWALVPVLLLQLWRAQRRNNAPFLPAPNRPMALPMSPLILTKMAICTLLLLLSVLLIFRHFDPNDYYAAKFPAYSLLAPLTRAITMFGMFVVIRLCQLYGFGSSGIVHLSWLVHFVCALPELYGWFQKLFFVSPEFEDLAALDLPRLGVSLCWSVALLVQCVLFLFSDSPAPSAILVDESSTTSLDQHQSQGCRRESPEASSSFISRLTFSWVGPVLRLGGGKRDLIEDDLFELKTDRKCQFLTLQWEHCWLPAAEKYYERCRHLRSTESSPLLLPNAEGGSAFVRLFPSIKRRLTPEEVKVGRAVPQPSIVWSLFKLFKYELLAAGFVKLFADILQFANPLLLNQLISFISDPNAHLWQGIVYSLAMFFCSEIRSLCVNYYFNVMFKMGTKIQSALTVAIYKKALKLSNAARRDRTIGEIVNLMAIDVERFQMITPHIQQFWSSPFQICVALVFLFNLLGIAALPGVLIMAVIIPLSFASSFLTRRWLMTQMQLRDERARLCSELLNGIKVIKMYAWEQPMIEAVERIRKLELRCIYKSGLVRSIIDTFNYTSPFLVAVGSFFTFVLLDPTGGLSLTPQIAFVSLTLFNQIRSPMTMIGMLVNLIVQTAVSNQRIREFLLEDELDTKAVEAETPAADSAPMVRVKGADFCWDDSGRDALQKDERLRKRRVSSAWSQQKSPSGRPTLRDISLELWRGQLVAVVGKVGAGKSSLLAALLGEMGRPRRGEVKMLDGVDTSTAYVPQVPWIQNLSLRDNILFGRPFEKEWYERVIDACALRADVSVLPNGDATEIGEKGINLSGGQKARVALARAVYQRHRELFLLDDPLSAVDSHVGKWIFEKVIGPGGLLDGRSRVLVTHGIHFLGQMDQIIMLEGGRIIERGTFDELSFLLGTKFAQFVTEGKIREKDKEAKRNGAKEKKEGNQRKETEQNVGKERPLDFGTESLVSDDDLASTEQIRKKISQLRKLRRSQSSESRESRSPPASFNVPQRDRPSTTSSDATATDKSLGTKSPQLPTALIEKERVETGRVKFLVYLQFIRAAGWLCSVLFLLFYVLNQGMQIGRNFWLSDWADDNQRINFANATGSPQVGLSWRLVVYAAYGIAEALSFLFALFLLLFAGLNASRNLHSPLLSRVMRAPMEFFDTTPIGRLLNRFGRDIEVADSDIVLNIRYFVQSLLTVLATLLTICISTWTFSVVILPLFLCYFYILHLYVPISRQMKRLESNRRSPIYSHFSESVQGAPTIRAFRRQIAFCSQLEHRIDSLIRIRSLSLVANRWLAVRLEFLGNCITLFAALFGAFSRQWNLMSSAGLVGLSVSYALNITDVMNFAIRQISELETNIVSIERLKEYSEVETEAPWQNDRQKPPPGWPQHGQIVFEHYSTRYRPGLELVLRDIVATVRPSEKIGIVGRTGAGKSSLTLALFRIIESAAGFIVIDGVNISDIGLHDLRSNITIIPQDPVLFSGTLRFNLDPFSTHSDARLWEVLQHSHLHDFVAELPGRLEHQLSEGGENISLGQRQLLCLARALLRFSRVLVLDEATASVDLTTDALIQETIRREFRHCTVFTIAHRLETILDYDRVLVLCDGRVHEFDSPQTLLANQNSMFASMASDARIGRGSE